MFGAYDSAAFRYGPVILQFGSASCRSRIPSAVTEERLSPRPFNFESRFKFCTSIGVAENYFDVATSNVTEPTNLALARRPAFGLTFSDLTTIFPPAAVNARMS